MKKLLINLAIILLATTISSAQGGGIRAKVIDSDGEPIPFASVVLKTDKVIEGQITNDNGWFHFKGIASGIYSIEISFIGFATRKINEINVNDGSLSFLDDITIGKSIISIGDVIISTKLLDPSDPSAIKMSSKIIDRLPDNKTMGGIISAISTDIQVTEDKKDIVVRGSRPGNSAFYIDGIRSESMSAISGSNIKSLTVYSGGIPASYGDITGGVVVVETKGYFDYYYKWRAAQRNK